MTYQNMITMNLRLSQKERIYVEMVAKELDISFNDVLRQLVRDAAKDDPNYAPNVEAAVRAKARAEADERSDAFERGGQDAWNEVALRQGYRTQKEIDDA